MKREVCLTGLTASLLAFFIAWGAGSCLVSAFDLPLTGSLVPVCAGLALVSAVLLSFRRGGLVLLCLGALVLGYLWRDGLALRQLWNLMHYFSTVYNRAYGCGVLVLPDQIGPETGYDWPVWIWCGFLCGAVCRSVCRQRSAWLPCLAAIVPLISCVVVTDTVPGPAWLLMMMAGLILLLLTAAVREENNLQGLRLTAGLALPVTAALTALFLAVPQTGYGNQGSALRERFLSAVQTAPQVMQTGMEQLASGLQSAAPKQIGLKHLGPRTPTASPVMYVTADRSGPLYLRQQDFDRYDGLGWYAGKNREEVFSQGSGEKEVVAITTHRQMQQKFLPYYPAEETRLQDGCLENTGGTIEYAVLRQALPEDWRVTACQDPAENRDQWADYCLLPESTRREAAVLLQGLYPAGASNTEKADVIAALVTDSAEYDLDPSPMPDTAPDFALWFLEEGERGYCVHFATAATVLLRAARVPARYVTGYMVQTQAGIPVTVTEENAHAWAEYYEPNLDVWIPLEATPARGLAGPEEPTQSTQPPITEAPETEAASPVPEASLPEEPAAPGETDDPVLPEQQPPDLQEAKGRSFLWLLCLPVLAAAAVLQRRLRRALRRRRQHRGDANQQALARWQEVQLLSRLLKEIPPEELIGLAQKAKFSQHRLTDEELQAFAEYRRSCLVRLKKKPWYLQLIYRYGYAVC